VNPLNTHPHSFTWEIHCPLHQDTTRQVWLMELAEMRGRVLHAGGRRPHFLREDGRCCDPDPLDRCAYHILVRSSAHLVGSIRVVPLTSGPMCGTECLVGHERFEQLLVDLGTRRHTTGEVGRWIVAPEYSPFRMGVRLIAAVGVLSKWLGIQAVIATVGTRGRQAKTLMRAGGRRVPGLAPIYSYKYDDDLVVLTFDLSHPVESFGPFAIEMAARLSLRAPERRRRQQRPSALTISPALPRPVFQGTELHDKRESVSHLYGLSIKSCGVIDSPRHPLDLSADNSARAGNSAGTSSLTPSRAPTPCLPIHTSDADLRELSRLHGPHVGLEQSLRGDSN